MRPRDYSTTISITRSPALVESKIEAGQFQNHARPPHEFLGAAGAGQLKNFNAMTAYPAEAPAAYTHLRLDALPAGVIPDPRIAVI